MAKCRYLGKRETREKRETVVKIVHKKSTHGGGGGGSGHREGEKKEREKKKNKASSSFRKSGLLSGYFHHQFVSKPSDALSVAGGPPGTFLPAQRSAALSTAHRGVGARGRGLRQSAQPASGTTSALFARTVCVLFIFLKDFFWSCPNLHIIPPPLKKK